MKSGIIAIFSVILMVFSAAVVMAQSDDSDAAGSFTVTGYVGQIGNTGITAVSGKEVIISDPADRANLLTWGSITDSNGYFSIKIETDESHLSELGISIDYTGYAIMAGPCVTPDGDDCGLNLLEATRSGDTFQICSKLSNAIIVSTAKVSVNISITGSDKVLKGAMVTLYSGSTVYDNGETDENGIYTVNKGKDVQTGNYRCVITCDGYNQKEESIEVTIDKTDFTIQLEEKSIATYGGLTTYQILMVAGVAIGVILVVISYALCKRNWALMDDSEE